MAGRGRHAPDRRRARPARRPARRHASATARRSPRSRSRAAAPSACRSPRASGSRPTRSWQRRRRGARGRARWAARPPAPCRGVRPLRALALGAHLGAGRGDRGISAAPPHRLLLGRLPGRVRRHPPARAAAGGADRLCLRPGPRRPRRGTRRTGRSGCSASSTRPPTGDSHPFTRNGDTRNARSGRSACCSAAACSCERRPEATVATTPADFDRLFPGTGGALYGQALARLGGLVPAAGRADAAAGSVPGGGQRASGAGRADGGAVGAAGGGEPARGPRFDQPVPPHGYAWWYVDALSDDGRHGITLIAFIGSVFSPYYAWTRRRGRRPAPPLRAERRALRRPGQALGADRAGPRQRAAERVAPRHRPERARLGRRRAHGTISTRWRRPSPRASAAGAASTRPP